MLAGGAAAVILLGGAGYGLTAALAGHPAGPAGTTTTAALTAVKGCAALAQVTGTLEQVTGTALVIQTPGGQPVTVTTTASTRVNLSAAPLSDITDGAYVRVDGVTSGGRIAAGKVAVGELPSGKPQPPGGQHTVRTLPGGTIAQGTVADATSAGFTVDTPAGTQVPVTTTSRTLVVINSASPGDLQTGADTIVRRLRQTRQDAADRARAVCPDQLRRRGDRLVVPRGPHPHRRRARAARQHDLAAGTHRRRPADPVHHDHLPPRPAPRRPARRHRHPRHRRRLGRRHPPHHLGVQAGASGGRPRGAMRAWRQLR